MKKTKADPRAPVLRVFETFRTIDSYEVGGLRQTEPSCFNGEVRVNKFRVTVEVVDEPKEVVAARIQKLWDECDNYHHWIPLRNAAAHIGYELHGEAGSQRKDRRNG